LGVLETSFYVRGRLEGEHFQWVAETLNTPTIPFAFGAPEGRSQQWLPARIVVDDEFLFMIGLYLAEGSASRSSVSFTMHTKEGPVLERVARYLRSLGIDSSEIRVNRAANLVISSALLGRLMKSLCGVGAEKKHLNSKFFRELSHKQLWGVFNGWKIGDGHRTSLDEARQISITSISERLAVQMGFIALANELFPRTYTHECRSTNLAYALNLFASNWRGNKPGHGKKNIADTHFIYSPVAGEGQYRNTDNLQQHYSGPVFDIQVEDAESFVTSSGIVHNCRIWGTTKKLACPHGCIPERWLSDEEAGDLLREAAEIPCD
jgi:hypothetical protein